MMAGSVEIVSAVDGAPRWRGVQDIAYIRQEGYFLRLVRLPCGKRNCSKCPHGPYWYFGYSRRRKVKQIYLGKSLLGERTLRNAEVLAVVRAAMKERNVPAIASEAEGALLREKELGDSGGGVG